VIQKTLVKVMHHKTVFVKVESRVIEISVAFIDLDGRVRIEIKHLYPCFIAVIKYGYSIWC